MKKSRKDIISMRDFSKEEILHILKISEEVENDENHSLRSEITQKLHEFSKEIQTEEKWVEEFQTIKNDFLKEEKIQQYSTDIWNSIKKLF